MSFLFLFLLLVQCYCEDIVLFYDCPKLITCSTDDDCNLNAAGTCIEGHCFLMKPAGAYCLEGNECASYFYYGPRACTTECSVLSKCQSMLKGAQLYDGFMCCRAIPLGSGCKSKDSLYSASSQHHGGCDRRSVCANDYGKYKCLPKDTYFWKYLSAFIILASIIVNIAYVLKRVQINVNPTPGSSFGIFWVASIGSLAILVCYLLGPLTFVAPLANTGMLIRLWFSIFTGRVGLSILVDIILTVNLLLGVVFVIMYGQRYEKSFNACEIIALVTTESSMQLFRILLIMLIILYVTMKFIEANTILRPSRYLQDQPIERMTMLTQKPLITPYDALFRVNWSYTYPDSFWNLFILPICYGYVVAFFLVCTIVAGKIVRAIFTTYQEMNPNLSRHWRNATLCLSLAILTTILQFYWTLKAFRRISSRLIEVIITVFSVVLVCIVGWIVFEELDNFSRSSLLYFGLAVTAILFSNSGIILRKEEI